jgi:putative addiction module component (TIGR02574 family)
MNPQAETVLDAILRLSVEDRLEIVEAVERSLPPNEHPFLDEWRTEVRRRSEELRSGKAAGVAWEEVKRRADEITRG